MNRRTFVRTSIVAFVGSITFSSNALAAKKKFLFKIRTKSGGIVCNIQIEVHDVFAALTKLKKRYSGCEVLEAKEK